MSGIVRAGRNRGHFLTTSVSTSSSEQIHAGIAGSCTGLTEVDRLFAKGRRQVSCFDLLCPILARFGVQSPVSWQVPLLNWPARTVRFGFASYCSAVAKPTNIRKSESRYNNRCPRAARTVRAVEVGPQQVRFAEPDEQ